MERIFLIKNFLMYSFLKGRCLTLLLRCFSYISHRNTKEKKLLEVASYSRIVITQQSSGKWKVTGLYIEAGVLAIHFTIELISVNIESR